MINKKCKRIIVLHGIDSSFQDFNFKNNGIFIQLNYDK